MPVLVEDLELRGRAPLLVLHVQKIGRAGQRHPQRAEDALGDWEDLVGLHGKRLGEACDIYFG